MENQFRLELNNKHDERTISQQLKSFGIEVSEEKSLEYEEIKKEYNRLSGFSIMKNIVIKWIYNDIINNLVSTTETKRTLEDNLNKKSKLKLNSWQRLISKQVSISCILSTGRLMYYEFSLGKNFPPIKKQLKAQGLKIKGKKVDNQSNVLYAIEHFIDKGEETQERYDSQYKLLMETIYKKVKKNNKNPK